MELHEMEAEGSQLVPQRNEDDYDNGRAVRIDKFDKITNWVKLRSKQRHSKVPLNSFPMVTL